MSSDFFVWCFIDVNFEEIWTRPYRDVMVWRTEYNKKWSISTLRETYINWNWLDQAWGRFRDALYEINVLYEMWSIVDLKMLLKLASRCWVDGLYEICWCASFVCWPIMFLVLHLLRSFLKNICGTSPGAFDCLKVDVLNLFTSPGAFEILCHVSQNELWRIFLLPDIKLVEIWRWRSSPLFSMAFMLQRCVVFAEDDAKIS